MKPVNRINQADIILVYSCGSFNTSEEATINTITRILEKKSKNAKVIVTGCLVGINPDCLKEFSQVIMLPSNDLDQLDSIINARVPFEQIPDANHAVDVPDLIHDLIIRNPRKLIIKDHFKKDYFLKAFSQLGRTILNKNIDSPFGLETYNLFISRGCLGRCSYCLIKKAHGKLQSNLTQNIISQFEQGLAKGHRLFVLIGEDTGCYGLDIRTNIIELLEKLFSFDGNYKIIIDDFNARWLVKYFQELEPLFIKNHDKIYDFRVPIQSGSDKILELMKRDYKIEQVEKCLSILQSKIPSLRIHTHMIVGFPGETEEDFEKTKSFLRKIRFQNVAIYKYQDRSLAESYNLPNKISSKIIEERVDELRALLEMTHTVIGLDFAY